jgi:hypothetical protein
MKVLVDIKHDRYRDDKDNREDVCTNEFSHDVLIQTPEISERIQILKALQVFKPSQPGTYLA